MRQPDFLFSKLAFIFAVFTLVSCGSPNVTSFTSDGPERSIVQLGGDVIFTRVYWDAGTASEVAIPSGFLGANFFSVPPGTAVGSHNFQLERNGDRTPVMAFNVTAPRPITPPRFDHVMIAGSQFKAGNQVSTLIMAQGANVDVGAELLINGVADGNFSYKVMINDVMGTDPTTLDFPIYHYTALVAGTGDRPAGSVLQLRIRNLDGQLSNTIAYSLPTSAANVDSDGDNIPDDWEVNGYDADGDGTIDIDLKALGAHPNRRDLFLECDIMTGLTNTPTANAFQAVQDAFSAAPIINFGNIANGMNLIIDRSGTVPFSDDIEMDQATNPATGLVNFNDLKSTNFNDAVRGRIYQYAIWANARTNNSSGISDPSINAAGTDFSGPGDDLIVSFDDFSSSFQSDRSGAETLMHEFGHNLIQRHGGDDHFSQNPTYNSVMSYNWQLRSGRSNTTRRSRPCCPPLYYSVNGASEPNGALFTPTGNIIDYSEGMGRDLVENALSEIIGVCDNDGVDWNSDGDTNDNNATRDINNDGDTSDSYSDYCNWCFLNYRGPELNGGN